jgi:trehalose synthase
MKHALQLDRYETLVGEDVLAEVHRAAQPLTGLRVTYINTTVQGGGVAELLQGIKQGELSQEEQGHLLDTLRHAPVIKEIEQQRADLYFVHDFQLAPLAALFPWMRPAI